MNFPSLERKIFQKDLKSALLSSVALKSRTIIVTNKRGKEWQWKKKNARLKLHSIWSLSIITSPCWHEWFLQVIDFFLSHTHLIIVYKLHICHWSNLNHNDYSTKHGTLQKGSFQLCQSLVNGLYLIALFININCVLSCIYILVTT